MYIVNYPHNQACTAAFLDKGASAAPGGAVIVKLAVIEKEAIRRAVGLCGGDMKEAPKKLGISVVTIYRKIKKYGIDAG